MQRANKQTVEAYHAPDFCACGKSSQWQRLLSKHLNPCYVCSDHVPNGIFEIISDAILFGCVLDDVGDFGVECLRDVWKEVVYGLVIEGSTEPGCHCVAVSEVERGFDLEGCPVFLDISVGIGDGPGDVVVYVRGLEDEGEVDGPDEIGNGVEGHHAEESDAKEGHWENVVLEGINRLEYVSLSFSSFYRRNIR